MTREEAKNELVLWRNRNSDNGYHKKFVDALTVAIKALKQKPCAYTSQNDVQYITKQAALEALGEEPYNWNDSPEEITELATWRACYKAIENLPAVDLTYRFKEGYEQALDDISEIMDSGGDLIESMYKVQRFIIKYKTGIDIAKLTIED